MSNNLLIKRMTLPNGIRLVQFPRSQKMTAQLSVVIQYGSKLDSEKNAGIAHYLEHMVGGRSKTRQILMCIDLQLIDLNSVPLFAEIT